jgi:subtilisin family serine protease
MNHLHKLLVVVLLSFSILLAASPAAASGPTGQAPLIMANGKGIPNQYIVVLKAGGSARSTGVGARPAAADPQSIAATARAKPKFVYDAALNGFAAQLTAGQLNALRQNPNVDYIEQDQVATIDGTQYSAPWGLDRIDQHFRPLSTTYTYKYGAASVYAYVIDSGIQTNHPDFNGRAVAVYDAFGGNGQDCNGHGTHVAGTLGSYTYGVAKGVKLRGVRVLNCAGSGSYSQIIAGVNWVANYHANPAVANMSLGGSYSAALNSAVTNMINSGVFTAVAAGNSNLNSCNFSPASAPGTLTVAATNSTDGKAAFSNYGACVDVYAPGVNIKSTWLNGGTNMISGTSMASPHVAGVAALYKATYGNVTSSTIVSWIINNSTTNVVAGNVSGTPNRLLFKSSL